MLKSIKKTLGALHTDDQGADMVEYILIVAAVSLPLLAVIIWFWQDIGKTVDEWWGEIKDSSGPSGGDGGTVDPGNLR